MLCAAPIKDNDSDRVSCKEVNMFACGVSGCQFAPSLYPITPVLCVSHWHAYILMFGVAHQLVCVLVKNERPSL